MARPLMRAMCYQPPLSAGLGAVIILATDQVGRMVAFPAETLAAPVTAIVGAPFLLFLARRSLSALVVSAWQFLSA